MKLNRSEVKKIRRAHAKGDSLKALAEKFNVSPSCIFGVVNNLTYFNAEFTPAPASRSFDVAYARAQREKGKTYPQISAAEAKKHARKKPYSVSWIRSLLTSESVGV